MSISQNSTMSNSIPFQITISIFNLHMMPNLRIKTYNQLKIDHFKHFLNKNIFTIIDVPKLKPHHTKLQAFNATYASFMIFGAQSFKSPSHH
jgi:hypothetical protein